MATVQVFSIKVDTIPPANTSITGFSDYTTSCTVSVGGATDAHSGFKDYSIQYSTSPGFEAAVTTVTAYFTGSSTRTLALIPSVTYYFQARARDNVLNVSAWTEPRAISPSITWDGGGGDNNWYTAANWSGDFLPFAQTPVTISSGGITITASEGSPPVNVASLNLNQTGGNLVINASTITVTGTFISSASAINCWLITAASMSVTGGTISASSITVTTDLTVKSGATLMHSTSSVSGLAVSAGKLDILSGGEIDLTGKGYAGGVSIVTGAGPGLG